MTISQIQLSTDKQTFAELRLGDLHFKRSRTDEATTQLQRALGVTGHGYLASRRRPSRNIMTNHSEHLNDLAAALAKAQAELGSANADGIGHVGRHKDRRSYRYATLASVWDSVRKPLTDHGLCVTQTCELGNRGELRLTTMLLHESGQWVAGTETVPMSAQNAQGYGSALTYARRYGLAAIVGACVDDDDDGDAASGPPSAQQQDLATTCEPPASRQLQAAQPLRAKGGLTGNAAWRQLSYNQAKETDLKLFAQAYARAKGVDSVTSDDIRRDFGVSCRLIDYFGETPLGQILERIPDPVSVDGTEGEQAGHPQPAQAA